MVYVVLGLDSWVCDEFGGFCCGAWVWVFFFFFFFLGVCLTLRESFLGGFACLVGDFDCFGLYMCMRISIYLYLYIYIHTGEEREYRERQSCLRKGLFFFFFESPN